MSEILDFGFRNRLREERKRLGYTQEQFAEQAGIKRVTQYLYENNEESSPNHRYFKAIADLGVDLHYVIFNERKRLEGLDLTPQILRSIFRIVHELARDKKGKPLPLKEQEEFFLLLCTLHTGRVDNVVDINRAKTLLK